TPYRSQRMSAFFPAVNVPDDSAMNTMTRAAASVEIVRGFMSAPLRGLYAETCSAAHESRIRGCIVAPIFRRSLINTSLADGGLHDIEIEGPVHRWVRTPFTPRD